MSTENPQPVVLEKCCVSKRCCCKCLCLTAVLVGLVGAVVTWFLFPVHYEATAWLFAHAQTPYVVFQADEDRGSYESFLASQFAMIRSPLVLQDVASDPRVTTIGSLCRAKDIVGELGPRIQLQRQGKSEYFTISYRDPDPMDALAVVSAVTDAYLKRVKNDEIHRDTDLVQNLMHEKVTFENSVKVQQKIIAELMKQAADRDSVSVEDQTTVAFLDAKLRRDNQMLDILSERIIKLQTETHAPARISLASAATLPTEPCTQARLPLSILVGIGLFVLTFVCAGVRRLFV